MYTAIGVVSYTAQFLVPVISIFGTAITGIWGFFIAKNAEKRAKP